MIIREILQQFQEYNKKINQVNKELKTEIQELEGWEFAEKLLKNRNMVKIMDDASILMFKLVLFYIEEKDKDINKGWNKGLEEHLEVLKRVDVEKWFKIQKYITK